MNDELCQEFQVAGRSFVAGASVKDPRVGIYEMPECRFVASIGPDPLDSPDDNVGIWCQIAVDADLEFLKQLEPAARKALQLHSKLRADQRRHCH